MSEIERYDCEEDRSCEYEVKAVMQINSTGYYVRHADHLVYLNEMRLDRDAQRLRADTAEAELGAVKQTLDATRDALEAAQYAKGELTSRLSEHEQLFYDLKHSPHAVSVSLELWKRITVFAAAALNQKSEGESQ